MPRSLLELPIVRRVAAAFFAAGTFGLSGCSSDTDERNVDDAFVACVYDEGDLGKLELSDSDSDELLSRVRDESDCERDQASHGHYFFVHSAGANTYTPGPSRLSSGELSAARSSGLVLNRSEASRVRSVVQDRVSGLNKGSYKGNSNKIPSTVRGGFGTKFQGKSGFSGGKGIFGGGGRAGGGP